MLRIALIDKSYFYDNPFLINNIVGDSVSVNANITALNKSILYYSDEYINHLLGEELADLFIDAINTDIDNLESRFSTLLSKIVDSENTESALQGYVYFNHRKNQMVISTNAGESKPSSEIGESTIDFSKLFIALKDCRKKTEKIVKYLTDNSETYPEWEFDTYKFCEANPLGL